MIDDIKSPNPESHSNGIATPAQIRQAAESQAWGAEERVVLPKSGFAVVMRRPTRFYFALRFSRWPAAIRSKLEAIWRGEPGIELDNTEVGFYNQQQDDLAWQAFVSPKPCLEPGFDQFDPRWLPEEDRDFLRDYLRGQVDASGVRLETFSSGPSGPAQDGSVAGQNLPPVAQ